MAVGRTTLSAIAVGVLVMAGAGAVSGTALAAEFPSAAVIAPPVSHTVVGAASEDDSGWQ